MSGPDVDAEFFCHMIPQWVLGKHAFDRFGQEFCRIFSKNMLRRRGLEPTRKATMTAIKFRGHFVAGQMDLFRIHDHDMVTHVHMRGKGWTMFATQHPCDAGCQSPQRFPLRIHEVPFFLHVQRLLHVCQHQSSRSFAIE